MQLHWQRRSPSSKPGKKSPSSKVWEDDAGSFSKGVFSVALWNFVRWILSTLIHVLIHVNSVLRWGCCRTGGNHRWAAQVSRLASLQDPRDNRSRNIKNDHWIESWMIRYDQMIRNHPEWSVNHGSGDHGHTGLHRGGDEMCSKACCRSGRRACSEVSQERGARLLIWWTRWTCILSLVALVIWWFKCDLKIQSRTLLGRFKIHQINSNNTIEINGEVLNSKPILCVQTDQTVPRTTGPIRCQCQREWRQWGHCCIREPWRNFTLTELLLHVLISNPSWN